MRSRVLLPMVLVVALALGLCTACNRGELCVETFGVGLHSATGATLCGRLTEGKSTVVGFAFWQTDRYDQEQNRTIYTCNNTVSGTEDFYYDVGNLQPGTSYSYKAWAKESGGDKIVGDTVFFTTDPQITSTVVATRGTSNLTSSSVTLHGEVVSMGMASTLYVEIQVGTASGALNSIYTITEPVQAPGGFSVDLTGLNPDTTYYYRAAGSGANAVVTPGEEKSFKTLL